MKILLINQFYRPDVAATGQLLGDLAEKLATDGHEVHVLCSRGAYGGGEKRYPKSEVVHGVQIHRVGAFAFGRGNFLGRVFDYLSFYLLALVKALLLRRMDVCVALTTPPFVALVALMLRTFKKSRVVLWTMDLYPEVPVAYGMLKENSLLHRVLRQVSRYTYRKAWKIISLGEVMTRRLVEAGADPHKISTVHNWVPGDGIRPQPSLDACHPLKKQWQLEDQATVMYSGNLGGGHELETVLRAVDRLETAEQENLRVLLVGKGKNRKLLEELAAQLKLDQVTFHDPVPLVALNDSLAMGQVHIVSQKPGTQGLIVPSKIYGIMAAGRPAIFIGPEDCEPARIIRASGCGRVVPSGDIEGVADAIRLLTTDSGLRADMGSLARDYYEKHFGLERSVGRIAAAVSGSRPIEEVRPQAT